VDLDYDRALEELSTALKGNPSDSEALFMMGAVKRRQGKPGETVTYFEKARALDPLNARTALNLGETYALLRQPDAAERCYEDALRLNPEYNRAFAYKLRWRLRLRPELRQAHEVEHQAEAAGLGNDTIVLYHRVLLHVAAGEDEEALALLRGVRGPALEDQFYFLPAALLEAQVRQRQGRRAEARERYAEARRIADAQLASDPTDSRVHSALGLALAGLGEKTAAVSAGQAGVDALPVEKEAYRGAYRLEDLARIYAAVGERDKAVEILTRLMAMPTDLAGPRSSSTLPGRRCAATPASSASFRRRHGTSRTRCPSPSRALPGCHRASSSRGGSSSPWLRPARRRAGAGRAPPRPGRCRRRTPTGACWRARRRSRRPCRRARTSSAASPGATTASSTFHTASTAVDSFRSP